MSAFTSYSPASPNFKIMSEATLPPAPSKICQFIWKTILSTVYTATVSPKARPSPSIAPPITPLRPCGITTALIIAHLVAPSAYAAWMRSKGACAKISREIDVMIGIIIIARTTPATNGDLVKYGG